jgi:hypothetical protein
MLHENRITYNQPRIRGVEQYLEKWLPVYQEWFGLKGARKYVCSYRTKVLGRLVFVKLFEGDFREFRRLLFHVLGANDWAVSELFRLFRYFFRMLLRMCVPKKMIAIMKDRKSL